MLLGVGRGVVFGVPLHSFNPFRGVVLDCLDDSVAAFGDHT